NIGFVRSLNVLLFCWVLAVGLNSCTSEYIAPDALNTQTDNKKDDPKDGTGTNTGGNSDVQTTGDGTRSNPFTVEDVIALNRLESNKENVWVKGVIVGQAIKTLKETEFQPPFTGEAGTNIVLAAKAGETNITKIIPIQLPSGKVRNGLNLPQNGENLSKTVLLYGSLGAYFKQAGVKNVTYAQIDDKEYGTKPKE
ncbi:MAG: hypothetical protein II502_01880, partial [Paludibacteraceae bacterium]|nr:hypothetical protein [Paludibacteraceae bacterium]